MEYPVTTILDIGHRKKRKLDTSRPDTHNIDRFLSHSYALANPTRPSESPYNSGSPYTGRGPGHSGLNRKAAETGKRKMLDGMLYSAGGMLRVIIEETINSMERYFPD